MDVAPRAMISYTVDTVDTVKMVYTIDMVYTVDTLTNIPVIAHDGVPL